MAPSIRSLALRYAVPFLSVGAALLLTQRLTPLLDSTPRVLFFGAVFLSTLLGGRWPGLLAILLSLLALIFFFDNPIYALELNREDFPRLVVFLFTALLISSVSFRRQQDAAALKKANAELEDRVGERTAALEAAYTALKEEMARREVLEGDRARLLANEQAARAEAEQANRAKDDFLALISHEFRNPLNTITGWVALVSSGQADAPTVTQAMEVIKRSAELLAHLVSDLLDTSQIIAGRLRIDARPTNLVEVVQAAVESMRPAADKKRVELKAVLSAGEIVVMADARRLQQIISNLLSNAVKFTPGGGHVEIAIEVVAAAVEIRMRDSGRGIQPEAMPHIFEKFWQAEGSTGGQRGLGLGLAIVKHLTELHGGTVAAESEGQDRGATFTVRLPLAGTNGEAPPNPEGEG